LEKKERDTELDNIIPRLGIAEYQENRLSNIIASRLDRSNPVAFSKTSSMFTVESEFSKYRITIGVDIIGTERRSESIIRSFRSSLRSPIFIIIGCLFSAIICIIAFLSVYWPSTRIISFSNQYAEALDKQYSLTLDRCAGFLNGERINPRTGGPLYASCGKTITQLHELCKEHQIATCQDERIALYFADSKHKT